MPILMPKPTRNKRKATAVSTGLVCSIAGRLALTVSKSYLSVVPPEAAVPTAARNHAPTIVAAQATSIMTRYFLAARMFSGFRCSKRIRK